MIIILDLLIPYLKENGSMTVGNLYQINTEVTSYQCYQKSIRNQSFPPDEFEYYHFDDIYDVKYKPQKR